MKLNHLHLCELEIRARLARPKLLRMAVVATIAILAVVSPSRSQFVVDLLEPPPAQMHIESLWRINLINQGSAARTIRLYATAVETPTGRRIAEALSSSFRVPPGFMSVGPNEISPIDYEADPEYEGLVTRTGSVPAGEYTICVFAIDDSTNDTLDRDCVFEHVVVEVVPPQLIYPPDNGDVNEARPMFTWLPIAPFIGDVNYRIRIVEMLGRQSPFAAIESNPPWFEEEVGDVGTLAYPLSGQPLEVGMRYAWQVHAIVHDAKGRAGEPIPSEIWSFTMASDGFDTLKTPDLGPDVDDDILITDAGRRSVPPTIDTALTSRLGARRLPVGARPATVPGKSNGDVCRGLHANVTHMARHDSSTYRVSIKSDLSPKEAGTIAPRRFRLRLVGDRIASIESRTPQGWKRASTKSPSTSAEWIVGEEALVAGTIELADFTIAHTTSRPVSALLEWIDADSTVLCRDSSVIHDALFYYDLGRDAAVPSVDVTHAVLNVQFFNDYASSESLSTLVYDAETRQVVRPIGPVRNDVRIINGLNRLSLAVTDYPFVSGRRYVLLVSDHKSIYRLNFTIAHDRTK